MITLLILSLVEVTVIVLLAIDLFHVSVLDLSQPSSWFILYLLLFIYAIVTFVINKLLTR